MIAVLVSETTSNTASAAIMVPNAIVYSSGLLPITGMLKAGSSSTSSAPSYAWSA